MWHAQYRSSEGALCANVSPCAYSMASMLLPRPTGQHLTSSMMRSDALRLKPPPSYGASGANRGACLFCSSTTSPATMRASSHSQIPMCCSAVGWSTADGRSTNEFVRYLSAFLILPSDRRLRQARHPSLAVSSADSVRGNPFAPGRSMRMHASDTSIVLSARGKHITWAGEPCKRHLHEDDCAEATFELIHSRFVLGHHRAARSTPASPSSRTKITDRTL